jgi:hypothetical protein
MKTIALASILAGAAVLSPAFAVGFTGEYAPENWTVANTGTLSGGSPVVGTAVFSTSQLVLTGGNSLSPPPGGDTPSCVGGTYAFAGPCQVQATIGLGGIYNFSWSYLTSDPSGPAGDIFGVIVDSNRIQLSDPGGPQAQSGTSSFTSESSFGWFTNCTDCIGGSASATVTNLVVAIPEPETYALMLAGAFALAARLKQGRKKRLGASA